MEKLRFYQALPVIAMLAVVTIVTAGCAPVPQTISPQDAQQIADNATIYGFPLVIMDLTRQVLTDVPAPNVNGSPVNQFSNMKSFPDASFTDVVRPNDDTLYSTAWIDTKEPVVLSVPDTKGRYYLLPMLNYWTDVFASPGSRTTGTAAGNFAITGPAWKGKLPPGMTEMKSSTRWVWIIGRFTCYGSSDYQNVWDLQDQLKLTPLSAWGTNYVPPTSVPVDPTVNIQVPPLAQLRAMDAPTYFNYICRLLVENPPYKADAPLLSSLTKIGIKPGADYKAYYSGLDDSVKTAIQTGYQSALGRIPTTVMGPLKNGWQMMYGTGNYGTNYMFRAAVAYQGLGANLVDDSFYPSSFISGDGQRYSSANKYILHLNKEQIPPVNGFWSLTMYNDQSLFAANPINRYKLGSLSDPPLITNSDGSIDLYIQGSSPDSSVSSNWLPTPASGDFSMTLRLYWPQGQVLDESWVPPAVQKVD